ncbi:hypothetical protein, partial [Bacillus cereus]|uniref:hypothetical protein n=1 Tax=Bacillus cereus TaxID=1396 RepID=UPI0024BCFEAD
LISRHCHYKKIYAVNKSEIKLKIDQIRGYFYYKWKIRNPPAPPFHSLPKLKPNYQTHPMTPEIQMG